MNQMIMENIGNSISYYKYCQNLWETIMKHPGQMKSHVCLYST